MAKGISLHIGLNKVDPDRYKLYDWRRGGDSVIVIDEGDPDKDPDPTNFRSIEIPARRWFRIGWVGPLRSCENDAEDMFAIAEEQGFEATLLKTEQATAERVMREIERAAEVLGPGDIFLLTYAGHGSQVDDRNGDERDHYDETWCLYDRMLLDDERHVALAKFAEGVRVIVVVDGCHSGTTMDLMSTGPVVSQPAEFEPPPRFLRCESISVRAMPRDVATAVYEGKRKEYDEIQDRLPSPRPAVRASVMLISACQDDELAGDGRKNGNFTAALKKVWRRGKFNGDYREFHARIASELASQYERALTRSGPGESAPNRQTPNLSPDLSVIGDDSSLAAFARERPFSI